MKTQTTKFLAVLAVLAMVFVVFAVSESTDANAAAPAIDLDGDMDFSVLDTPSGYEAVYDPTSGEITVTGIVVAGSTPYSGLSTFVKAEYAMGQITGIAAGNYIIKQTNTALKQFVGESEVEKVGNTYVKTKEYNFTNTNTYEFLIPKDGTSVTIEITNKATGAVVATYVFDFSKVSTQIQLGSGAITPVDESGWKYTSGKLELSGYNGRTIFKTSVDVTVDVKGSNTITSYGLAKSWAFELGGALTITNNDAQDAKADSLTIALQNGAYGIGISQNVTVTQTANGDLSLEISGGNRAIDANTIEVAGADLKVSGSEMAIRARATTAAGDSTGAIIVSGGSVINATIEKPETGNVEGSDAIFAIRSNGGICAKDAGTTITAQGLAVIENVLPVKQDANSIIYVTGEYQQTDYTTYKGVAGFYSGYTAGIAATYIAKATAGSAGTLYVVGDADAYNVTVTGAVVSKTATAAGDSKTGVLSDINTDASGVDKLTLSLGDVTAANMPTLDEILKQPNVASLKTLTIVAGTNVTSITASEDIDISKTEIRMVGMTFTGTVKNGSDSVTFQGVDGSFGVKAGSVEIDGKIVSGTAYVKGNVKMSGYVDTTSSVTIRAQDGEIATVEVLAGFYFKTGTLNLIDVAVKFDANLPMTAGSLMFGEDAYLVSDLTVVGADSTKCSVGFEEKQTQNITLSNVAVSNDLETTKKVTVADGTVAFGANSLKAAELDVALGATMTITGASAIETITISGDMNIAGTLNLAKAKLTVAGASEISGKIIYDADAIITNNGTMTVTETGIISGAATLATKAAKNVVNESVLVIKGVVVDLTNNKTIRLYGFIGYYSDATPTKAGKLVNDGIIYIMDAAADIRSADISGTGTVDTSAVSEEVTLSGVLKTDTTFTKYQIVTFIGNTTIRDTTDLEFQGNAIIPDGVTVTIEKGATMTIATAFGKLTNNGTIIAEGAGTNGSLYINGAQVDNNGTITLAYDATDAGVVLKIAAGSVFNNNGTIAIGEKSMLDNASANLINNGEITISGSYTGAGNIVNKANVTINSEVNEDITIQNAAIGATVTVVKSAADVTVKDEKITSKTTGFVNGENTVTFDYGALAAGETKTFGGFIIASATYKVGLGITSTELVISGAVAVDSNKENPSNVALTMTTEAGKKGRIDAALLSLTDVDLVISANTILYVSGVMSVDDSCSVDNDGRITVEGSIISLVEIDGNKDAAMYIIPANVLTETKKTWVYTTVPAAVEGATAAEVATVTVTGIVEIAEKVVVPAGMTLKIDGATVTIKEDIEVDIEADGTTFAVLNNTGTIKVDGKLVIDDVTKSKKGVGTIESEVIVKSGNTAIYTTLTWAMADVGTEEATITLGGPTFIKKNTVIPENITIDTNGNNFTVQNAELTIDGELYLNGGVYTVAGDNGKVIVNGCISKDSKMTYNGKEYPAGLYFSINDSAEYIIAGIAKAEAVAAVADGTITYYGDLKVNSIDFDAEGTLVFDGKVEAKAMEIGSKAKVTFNKDVAIDLVTVGVATITFKDDAHIDGTFVSPVGTIGFDDTMAVEDSKITVAVKDTVTTMTLEGSIGYLFSEAEWQVATLGDVIIKAQALDLEVGLGEVTIGANVTLFDLLVYGDLVVDNGYKLTVTDAAAVYGSLTANAATDTKAKATAEIGALAVGIEFIDSTGVAAVIAGEVTASVALVAADAIVPASISEMPYSTEVYAEGVMCLTAYASTSSESLLDLLENIDFDISDPNAGEPVWYDEDDVPVIIADIGDYDAIYGVWNYNVYSVTIVTDAGVKSVAINGIELVNIGGNVFVLGTDDDPLTPLKAGTYKVTYTLKTGYSGTAVLSTETGTILKDNSFVISPGSEIIDFNFQLAGTEPTPEPEPTPTPEEKSEWTITTILLVILVILIAIMAVIVALRLNRN